MGAAQSAEITAVLAASSGGAALGTALRRLFGALKGGDLFGMSPPRWAIFAALSEAAVSAAWCPDPGAPSTGATVEDLGEGWYLCHACSDAFEGAFDEAACPACGEAFGGGAPCLHVDLGDAGALWWTPGPGALPKVADRLRHLGSVVTRIRAEGPHGAFALFSEAERDAAGAALAIPLPHGARALGRAEDTLWLGHPERVQLWTLTQGGGLQSASLGTSWAPDFLADRLREAHFGAGPLPQ